MNKDFSPETIRALATLREAAQHSEAISHSLARAFTVLDNAGVFAALDEQADYVSAEDILAESALSATSPGLDPAEWGDTIQADIDRRSGLLSPVDEPLHGAAADEVRDALKYDRCPNGNTAPECTEIDPCEPCAQDTDDEGDAIERSMGLRD